MVFPFWSFCCAQNLCPSRCWVYPNRELPTHRHLFKGEQETRQIVVPRRFSGRDPTELHQCHIGGATVRISKDYWRDRSPLPGFVQGPPEFLIMRPKQLAVDLNQL